jgi:hypothetical protein
MRPDEEDPHRTMQNKNVIHKVMFYSGVTQPRFDAEGRCYFYGKLGVWPFVREVAILVMFYSCFATKEPLFYYSHKNICTFRNRHKEEVAIGPGAHLSRRQ